MIYEKADSVEDIIKYHLDVVKMHEEFVDRLNKQLVENPCEETDWCKKAEIDRSSKGIIFHNKFVDILNSLK